jgi:hypothetical protein
MESSDRGVQNGQILSNILRTLSMLEKAFDRLKRKNWYSSNYPDYIIEIEALLISVRLWIDANRAFSEVSEFYRILGVSIHKIGLLITELIVSCAPAKGKKREKKSRFIRERENILNTLSTMVQNLAEKGELLETASTSVGMEIEKALAASFERLLRQSEDLPKMGLHVSKRGRKTYVFPCRKPEYYLILVNDPERFKKEVLNTLPDLKHVWGHNPGCNGEAGFRLKGFRGTPRKTIMKGGKRQTYPIRMAECVGCGERFSILPSFLPREKHFCIDIIGEIVRSVCLFGNTVRGAFEISGLCGRKLKSIQTVMNWIKWMGFSHPAEILTRAGVKGSGYFQEDEGFEKEPDLRTYSVVMADPENMLVWHMDYVDHVDEAALCESFEKFVEKISFTVLGVTKDKWLPSARALKSVFHRIWIGFCHRHFLKKLWSAVSDWREQTGCGYKEAERVYGKVKEIMETANSERTLRIRIDMAGESAFEHPAAAPVIEELKKSAVHYTVHNKRSGIKKTTSIVDNFLKIVKRKLRQAESFRDSNWAGLLFRAMANVRNFVPFLPGARNAGKSPFMLAEGNDYDLPWSQVMNVQNAFLFVEE